MGSKKKELFKIWYRSVLAGQKSIWCESSSLKEVVRMSAGYKVEILEMRQYLVTEPWKPLGVQQILQRLSLNSMAQKIRGVYRGRF